MFYLIQKNKRLFTEFLLTIDNVKSSYFFMYNNNSISIQKWVITYTMEDLKEIYL